MSPPKKTFEKYINNIVEFVLVMLVFLLINVMGNIWFDILQFILWYKSLIYWSSSVRLSPFGFRPISWNVFSIIYTPPFHQVWREKDFKFLHDNQLFFFFCHNEPCSIVMILLPDWMYHVFNQSGAFVSNLSVISVYPVELYI